MKYRNRTDGSLVTKSQLKAQNSNTSLPKVWTADTLEFLGVDPVLASPKPDVGDHEVARPNGVEQDSTGNWVEAWAVAPMFVEYTNDDDVVVTAEEQIAQYEANKLAEARSRMSCTARQARLALAIGGNLALVESAVAAAGELAQVEWEYANEIERNSALIDSLTVGLGWTGEFVDELFTLAVTL